MTAQRRGTMTEVSQRRGARPSSHVSTSESPDAGEHGPAATSSYPTGPRCPSGRLPFSTYSGAQGPESPAPHGTSQLLLTRHYSRPHLQGATVLPLSQQPGFRCWPRYEPVNCEKTPVTGDHSWRFSAQGRHHSHTAATGITAGGAGESGGLNSSRSPQGV